MLLMADHHKAEQNIARFGENRIKQPVGSHQLTPHLQARPDGGLIVARRRAIGIMPYLWGMSISGEGHCHRGPGISVRTPWSTCSRRDMTW